MTSVLHVWILLISITLTIAVQLDGTCSNTTLCDGTSLTCEDSRCRCRMPFYKPCKSVCDTRRKYAYAGEQCEVAENCGGNAGCRDRVCACLQDHTPKNGLCFKSLNATCTIDGECWSGYCTEGQCRCPSGYIPQADQITCLPNLVKVYEKWEDANRDSEFCSDDNSCYDSVAQCIPGTQNSTTLKFCKCPPGHKAIDNNRKCDPQKSLLLSPLDNPRTNYDPCALCDDSNAACIQAAQETTCWCLSGYRKENEKCGKVAKPLIVFPNSNDVDHHDYTTGCPDHSTVHDKLCVCSPGYRFVAKDQPCEKIQPKWINPVYEYGLCTRIDSKAKATGENGLCPELLTCQAGRDKHICSCGKNKFLNLGEPTECVYYINSTTESVNDKCPTNAARNGNSGICECLPGYKVTNGNRQCDIELSSERYVPASCNSTSDPTLDDTCRKSFGKKAMFCSRGECRCSGNQSFANNAKTKCYAPLNETLVTPMEDCPPNSSLDNNRCKCAQGYRQSNDSRSCELMNLQLVQYIGIPPNINRDYTSADCRTVFQGPIEAHSNNRCQCQNGSLLNDNNNGCLYRLGVPLVFVNAGLFCPPNSSAAATATCECNEGFIRNGEKCMAITNQVYMESDLNAPNIAGLNERVCIKFFGTGATLSSRSNYCVCRTIAYPVESNSYCRFLVNEPSSELKGTRTCPVNSESSGGSPSACTCKKGYHVSTDRRTCETTTISLNGTINIDTSQATNCANFTNDDCIVKYGQHAYCHDEKCYCNRGVSYVNADNKCELFSHYIFPGVHERNAHSCTTDADCGDKGNTECGYLRSNSEYKVCKCKDGSLLDPKSQTCVANRCVGGCDAGLSLVCQGYQCVCKEGFYSDNGVCRDASIFKLQLHQSCNASNPQVALVNDVLECDGLCDRARCKLGYRANGTSCLRYALNKDRCFYEEESMCQELDVNAVCNKEKNLCVCKPSYYEFEDKCLRVFGSECSSNDECGEGMECTSRRCSCKPNHYTQQVVDIYNRPMQRCIPNGMNRIGFSPVLLLFLILARGFFT